MRITYGDFSNSDSMNLSDVVDMLMNKHVLATLAYRSNYFYRARIIHNYY